MFSGLFKPFFFTGGLISCLIAVYYYSRMEYTQAKHEEENQNKNIPLLLQLKSPGYFIWLFKEIINSSFHTASLVWQIKPQLSPVTGTIDTVQNNPIGKTLLANSITLTPGTVTMMVENEQMLIHALEKESMTALSDHVMDQKVADIFTPLKNEGET